MRRFMISTVSSRLAGYQRHRNGPRVFSGYLTTLSDRFTPPQDAGRNITWLKSLQKHHCFMSTEANPLDTTSRYNESNMKDEESDAIRIKVISKEHIKPSSPTPQNLRYYKLSILDQIEAPIYNSLLLFYPNHTDNNSKKVDEVILNRSKHLKRSLSETLTRIYPYAGKVASEVHIDCNDDGVYYVETKVDDLLENVLHKPDYKFLQRLIPAVDSSQQALGSYVTLVQVNFFKCGGVSISVQHNHKFADARSTMTFLNVWASIARQDPNQVYPTFVTSSSGFPQTPQLPFSPAIPLWLLRITPAILKPGKSATKRFVFNALALKELKAKASKYEPVSRVQAVLALFWKCVTVETQCKTSFLHLPIDMRSRCSPMLPEHSIGNFIMGTYAKFDPATGDIPETAYMAKQLKSAIKNVNSESVDLLRNENGHAMFVDNLRKSTEAFCDFESEYIMSSSLCNLGSKEANFGWGNPIWSCVGNQLKEEIQMFTNRIMLMDSCSDEGIEAWVTLEKQTMDVVMCNPELLSFASVDPSPL